MGDGLPTEHADGSELHQLRWRARRPSFWNQWPVIQWRTHRLCRRTTRSNSRQDVRCSFEHLRHGPISAGQPNQRPCSREAIVGRRDKPDNRHLVARP